MCAERGSTPRARDTSQPKCFAYDAFQLQRTEVPDQPARDVLSIDKLKAKEPVEPPIVPSVNQSDIPRVRAVSILESRVENAILAVQRAVVYVRAVWLGLEHLIIPAFVEERLSNVHEATGVRDEGAETKSQSGPAEIGCMMCTNPLLD